MRVMRRKKIVIIVHRIVVPLNVDLNVVRKSVLYNSLKPNIIIVWIHIVFVLNQAGSGSMINKFVLKHVRVIRICTKRRGWNTDFCVEVEVRHWRRSQQIISVVVIVVVLKIRDLALA